MKVAVPWKNGSITVEIPDKRILGIIEPNEVPENDERLLVEESLREPIGSVDLKGFLVGNDPLLVIVNDGTRPTPTAGIMSVLHKYLKGMEVTYLIATGVHRAPTEEEYEFIFGGLYEQIRHQIIVHNARNDENMVFLGTSEAGTDLYINKLIVEHRRILIIGSVEPHYFAGFTGGRKSFFPGVSSYRTITMNHKLALRSEAKALSLRDNPVHQDMLDAIDLLDNEIFSIQAVLDKHHHIYSVSSGDINSSFDDAVGKAAEVFVAEIPGKADIVVSSVRYPMDIDLYQSQKAMDNGRLALKDGGILILVSSCRDGVGEKAFYELLSSCDSPSEVLEKINQSYVLGYHKAAKMAETCLMHQVLVYSELEDDIWNSIFMKPVKDLQGTIMEAIEDRGPDARVLFLLDGSVTVPRVRRDY